MTRLVLASASPRRRALLAAAGVDFLVEPSDADESFDSALSAEAAARAVASAKARTVAAAHAEDQEPPFVLGADTMVVLGEDGAGASFLGKPVDEADAQRILRALSASRHRVITGIAVVDPAGLLHVDAETTWVTMRPWSEAEIEAYVASGEWRDKAGGYAIQESADRFVTSLEGGGFDNVVGLPVPRTLALLRAAGHRLEG